MFEDGNVVGGMRERDGMFEVNGVIREDVVDRVSFSVWGWNDVGKEGMGGDGLRVSEEVWEYVLVFLLGEIWDDLEDLVVCWSLYGRDLGNVNLNERGNVCERVMVVCEEGGIVV